MNCVVCRGKPGPRHFYISFRLCSLASTPSFAFAHKLCPHGGVSHWCVERRGTPAEVGAPFCVQGGAEQAAELHGEGEIKGKLRVLHCICDTVPGEGEGRASLAGGVAGSYKCSRMYNILYEHNKLSSPS